MYSGSRFLDSSQIRSKRGLNVTHTSGSASSLTLNAFKPPGVTGHNLGARDFLDHEAVRPYEPQCEFELGDTAD
jgi:hypothetical protein